MRIPLSALIVGLALALPLPGWAQGRITVTAEARVEAPPDVAQVTLGVTSRAETAAAAMVANSAELARVMDRLTAAGIAPRDIQTTGLSLSPDWQGADDGAPARITGYTAQNMVTVRVRDLGVLGPVLDAAVRDGANTLHGLSFGISAPDPLLDQARRTAVARALDRARLLAEAAGTQLGPILEISEGGQGWQPQPMFRAEAAAMDAVPVAGGEVSLTASVTLVIALQPAP
ncbi:MAG: SIMPL domain-containing protein [Rhodobacterales bacterium]|nr:SIMPL domain-containing protein [Rhodobacterales bacterium]